MDRALNSKNVCFFRSETQLSVHVCYANERSEGVNNSSHKMAMFFWLRRTEPLKLRKQFFEKNEA